MSELTVNPEGNDTGVSIFNSIASFEDGQRIAKMLCTSDLVPAVYKNNIPNTMIALEMAKRIGISPFMVMQNLDIIQGKPSWRSTFIIGALNSCGRFKPLRYEFIGNDPKADEYGCRCFTEDLDGNKIYGPTVTWTMVKAEGWLSKPGSKWKTMPELMFQYRAASFFGRLYAPDILNGMQSVEEIKDVYADFTEVNDLDADAPKIKEIGELLILADEYITEDDKIEIQKVLKDKDRKSYGKVIKQLKAKIPS